MLLPVTLILIPLISSSSALASSSANPSLKGVHPSRQHLYLKPHHDAPTTWACLNGSKRIPWSAINDDYCDCDDGSDEPGTSACPNATFYCQNERHVGADLRSSRVNDGLCEPECCDGSDEPEGVCPNRCEELGAVYRNEQAAVMKTRKTGSKIRSTYVAFAQKEQKRLKEAIEKLKQDVKEKQREVDRTKDVLGRTESLDAASLEIKKQSPLFKSLGDHNAAIKALSQRSKRYQEYVDKLEGLLNDLQNGYNPNYVDMAVINTVKAWKGIKGETETPTDTAEPAKEELPPSSSDSAEGAKDKDHEAEEEEAMTEEDKEDARWTDGEVQGLMRMEAMTLIMDHERHMSLGVKNLAGDQAKSMLFAIAEYIPDDWMPLYDAAKQYAVEALATMGLVPKPVDISAEVTQARVAHTAAKGALTTVEKELRKEEEVQERLFDPQWYGKQGEWRKLDGTCLSKDTGEYTYSVCLFGSATQKANNNGASNNLGTFSSWSNSPTVTPGEFEYYTKQIYDKGAQCWNGPQRSVVLHLSCGTENELLSISEPEKCEYHFVGRTPALCLPLEDTGKEEL